MQMTSSDLDPLLDIAVDPDADPTDVDRALAKFLLAYVRQHPRSSSTAPDGEVEVETQPE